jgi:hypothetical protein
MPTFFDPAEQERLLARLEALGPDRPALWGRMDAAQMLAHLSATLRMATGDLPVKAGLMSLLGRLLKTRILSGGPFRRNVPTDPAFVFLDPRSFAEEKARFLEDFRSLARGPGALGCPAHPFLGPLTPVEWGLLVHKHLDHHFRQFGV